MSSGGGARPSSWPKAGFAGREAWPTPVRWKEGAHGGTMGSPVLDQVEPRRAFIEENARDVRFLDV